MSGFDALGAPERVLVTGANGQVGRALARLLPGATLLSRRELDVTDAAAVRAAVREAAPALVVHAAAYTAVDAAEADEAGARAVNVDGTRNVAAAADEAGALLVALSTDYVFDGEAERDYREDDATRPLSVYGRTKLEAEEAARACARHLIVRTSWVFGDGRNFVASILRAAAASGRVQVVSDQTGRPTWAEDLASGLIALARAGATGLVHLAGGGAPCTWADLAEAALAEAMRAGAVAEPAVVERITTEQFLAGRPGPIAPRPRRSVLDCARAASAGVTLPDWRDAVGAYVRRLAATDLERSHT